MPSKKISVIIKAQTSELCVLSIMLCTLRILFSNNQYFTLPDISSGYLLLHHIEMITKLINKPPDLFQESLSSMNFPTDMYCILCSYAYSLYMAA